MPDLVNSGSITVVDGTSGVSPPAGSFLDVGVEDHPAVSIDVEGAFTATLVIEAISEAGPTGADWFTPVVLNAAGVASSATLTAAGRRFISAAGLARVRLRCTAFTSGPITATLRAGQGFVSAGGGGGGGAVTSADGALTTLGTTTDAGIITNIAGTAIAFLRGSIIQWAAFLARFPAALVNGALVHTGDTAHGATDAGNPVEIGFGAVAHGANPTAVTAGQRTRGYASRAGIPFIIGGHPNIINTTQNFTAAQTNTVLVANTAGTKIVVTGFLVTVGNGVTVNVPVGIGLAQTVTPPSGTTNRFGSHPNIAPGSGFGRGNGAGIVAIGADGDQVLLTSGVPTSGSIDCTVSYYTVPS